MLIKDDADQSLGKSRPLAARPDGDTVGALGAARSDGRRRSVRGHLRREAEHVGNLTGRLVETGVIPVPSARQAGTRQALEQQE